MRFSKKNLPALLGAIALIVIAVFWFASSGLEHIEDTNGPEDTSLTTITDENIIQMDMGSIGGPERSRSILTGDGMEFSSEKFTGVAEILYDNFIGKSDFQLDLTNLTVNGGNFRMVVVHNDEIVAELEPDMFVSFRLEDIKGTVSLRIAGESASFQFFMSDFDYDQHSHRD